MMPTILAFGASTSAQSINQKLAKYAANAIPDAQVKLIDLNDYSTPIYSVDEEAANGIPAAAKAFARKLAEFRASL